tara:strand:+ start:213 stop:2312 length:2100 start_codon:yes stop_codon:yes gene_type:complete
MNYNPTEQRRREEIARRKKAVRQQTISSQIPVADPRKQPLSESQKLRQRRTQKRKEESKATKQIRDFLTTKKPSDLALAVAKKGVAQIEKKVVKPVKVSNQYLNRFNNFKNTKSYLKNVANKTNQNIKNFSKNFGTSKFSPSEIGKSKIKISAPSKFGGEVKFTVGGVSKGVKREFDNFIFDTSALSRVVKGKGSIEDKAIVLLDTAFLGIPIKAPKGKGYNKQATYIENEVAKIVNNKRFTTPQNLSAIKTVDDFNKLKKVKAKKFDDLTVKQQEELIKTKKREAIDRGIEYQLYGLDEFAKKEFKKAKSYEAYKTEEQLISEINQELKKFKSIDKKTKDKIIKEAEQNAKQDALKKDLEDLLDKIGVDDLGGGKSSKKFKDEYIDNVFKKATKPKDNKGGGTATETKTKVDTKKKTDSKVDTKKKTDSKVDTSKKTDTDTTITGKPVKPDKPKTKEQIKKETQNKVREFTGETIESSNKFGLFKDKAPKEFEGTVEEGGGQKLFREVKKPIKEYEFVDEQVPWKRKNKITVQEYEFVDEQVPWWRPEKKEDTKKDDKTVDPTPNKKKEDVITKVKITPSKKTKRVKKQKTFRLPKGTLKKTIIAKKGQKVKQVGLRVGKVETVLDLVTKKQVIGKDVSPKISNTETDPLKSFKVLKESKTKPKMKNFTVGFIAAEIKDNGRRIDIYKRKTTSGKRRF